MKHRCAVEGCSNTAEAFCLTAKHFVCSDHHKLFHYVDGHPKRNIPIAVPWTWKT